MESTYTIPEASRKNVEKIIARYQKKAAQYGTALQVKLGDPYAKEIPVRRVDPITQTISTIRHELHEVFDLTIDGEVIRKDGYAVVAKIEHLQGGNVVRTIGTDCKPEWLTMKAHCDHCNGNHGQRITYIVRHEDGTEKQVGRTCLKDYCGINPQAVGLSKELEEIIEGMDAERYDFEGHEIHPAQSTLEALALAVMLQRTKGYTASNEQNSNKKMLTDLVNQGEHADEADHKKAEEIKAAILAMTNDEAFAANVNNIKSLLECGYCKQGHFGYIAYAPLAMERYAKRIEEQKQREAAKETQRQASGYIGEIGQRLTVDVAEMALLTSWETQWGWTYLYKFVDTAGNVLVWFASRCIEETKKIKATVKEHTERDGIKQTVITRCTAA